MTTAQLLEAGTRVYNHGDMANSSHFGTITKVIKGKFGDNYEVTPDEEEGIEVYYISTLSLSPTFLGHGGTRFVTEDAYNAFHQ